MMFNEFKETIEHTVNKTEEDMRAEMRKTQMEI